MTLRLSISDTDYFDFTVKPFHEWTVEEYIRIVEKDPEPSDMPPEFVTLQRLTGAPSRFIRIMSMQEVDKAIAYINKVLTDKDATAHALSKVHETLANWKEEHDGEEWNVTDAKAVLQDLNIFRETITAGDRTWTAPLVEPSGFGKWIDLQQVMDIEQTESESYVRACAVMMEGDEGPYPVQGQDQSDADYAQQCNEYTQDRRRAFMQAPWVDVMGCAAFFFSKFQRFAAITGHNMKSLRTLLSPKTKPERQVIPSGGEFMQS